MCGIFGSNNIETFRKLYFKNIQRGNFVRSITKLFPAGTKNDIRVETNYEQELDKHIHENPFCIYYIGHLQSPTSKIRRFDVSTSHPFSLNNQYLAHNGVLENDRELIEQYNLEGYNDVDSSVILPLKEKLGFVDAFSALQGTFACWYYNSNTGCLRILRSGSTLFLNGGNFTSVSMPYYKYINEGSVLEYNFTSNNFTEVSTFELNKAPFFL